MAVPAVVVFFLNCNIKTLREWKFRDAAHRQNKTYRRWVRCDKIMPSTKLNIQA